MRVAWSRAILVVGCAAQLSCGPDLVVPTDDIEIAFVRRYDDGTTQLRGWSPGSPDVALLPATPAYTSLTDLDWSADGRLLAYHEKPLDEASEIRVYDPATGEDRALGSGERPAWSPRSSSLELGFVRERDEIYELFVYDVETEVERRVGTGEVSEFGWAPDGERMVVVGLWPELDPERALYVLDLETGAPTRIDPDPADNPGAAIFDYSPQWSADGSRIAFISSERAPLNYYSRAYLIDPDGADLVEIEDEWIHGMRSPNWAPVGARLAVSYWYFDAVSASDRGVMIVGEGPIVGASSIAWSPDATRIAVVSRDKGLSSSRIYVSGDGAEPIELSEVEDPSWSDAGPAWRELPD